MWKKFVVFVIVLVVVVRVVMVVIVVVVVVVGFPVATGHVICMNGLCSVCTICLELRQVKIGLFRCSIVGTEKLSRNRSKIIPEN